MKHYGDITKLSGYDLPVVDMITGGSPCQDLSVAKRDRDGLSGERSGLFMEQIRIVKEMREKDGSTGRTDEYIRPRYMLWENVPGAFSSNKGKDFQAVLTEIVRIIQPDAPDVPLPKNGRWSKSGCLYDDMGRWSIAYRLHDAQFWGVAQRRKRVCVVADFGGLSAPEILFERKGLRWNSGESKTEGKESSATVEGSIGEPVCIEMTSTKNTIVDTGISHTLTARMGTGGNQVNAVCVNNKQCFTLQAFGDYSEQGKASSLKMRDYKDATDLIVENNQRKIIRRLTPKECERLQGFPDDWTDIGDWVDSKGKKHKPADSPRYRAIGNSIAIPFWFYVLRRISAQYERPATLGSLFDGIGGFPLAWERCNGKGTAIWASEIDEFCIAVTKYHFPEDDHDTGREA